MAAPAREDMVPLTTDAPPRSPSLEARSHERPSPRTEQPWVQVVGTSAILRPAKGKAAAVEPEAAPEETIPPTAQEPASPIEPELPIATPETQAPAKRRGRPPKSKKRNT